MSLTSGADQGIKMLTGMLDFFLSHLVGIAISIIVLFVIFFILTRLPEIKREIQKQKEYEEQINNPIVEQPKSIP